MGQLTSYHFGLLYTRLIPIPAYRVRVWGEFSELRDGKSWRRQEQMVSRTK